MAKPFHGWNTGSIPVGDASKSRYLATRMRLIPIDPQKPDAGRHRQISGSLPADGKPSAAFGELSDEDAGQRARSVVHAGARPRADHPGHQWRASLTGACPLPADLLVPHPAEEKLAASATLPRTAESSRIREWRRRCLSTMSVQAESGRPAGTR